MYCQGKERTEEKFSITLQKCCFRSKIFIGHDLTPYGYESYEEYYKEVDACAEPFKDDPAVTKQTFCQLQSRGHAYEQKRRVVYL